jgi:hypothetical protein
MCGCGAAGCAACHPQDVVDVTDYDPKDLPKEAVRPSEDKPHVADEELSSSTWADMSETPFDRRRNGRPARYRTGALESEE